MDEEAFDLEELQRLVLGEIESYRYEIPEGALGRPHSDEWVARQLGEMRAALVKPHWRVVEMRDTSESMTRETPELRRCVLVADDGNVYQLYYDPVEEDFVLAFGDPPETFGVRGDAVGCFMAR